MFCSRKNPVHFQECSHPGDTDYEEEEEETEEADRPECPYGTDCYRSDITTHPLQPPEGLKGMMGNPMTLMTLTVMTEIKSQKYIFWLQSFRSSNTLKNTRHR